MTCKDCIHHDVCLLWGKTFDDIFFENGECRNFKDKSIKEIKQWELKIPIELPDDWTDQVVEKLKQSGDFVLVVRCKDCKHCNHRISKQNKQHHYWCYKWGRMDSYYPVKPDDFCSYGEEREVTNND